MSDSQLYCVSVAGVFAGSLLLALFLRAAFRREFVGRHVCADCGTAFFGGEPNADEEELLCGRCARKEVEVL